MILAFWLVVAEVWWSIVNADWSRCVCVCVWYLFLMLIGLGWGVRLIIDAHWLRWMCIYDVIASSDYSLLSLFIFILIIFVFLIVFYLFIYLSSILDNEHNEKWLISVIDKIKKKLILWHKTNVITEWNINKNTTWMMKKFMNMMNYKQWLNNTDFMHGCYS